MVAGKPPDTILGNKTYQSLREQVRFFNGEFLSLLEQETPLTWLKENTEEKLSFFESNLQCFRPDCETGLHQLKTALTQGNLEGFTHIAQYPFKDQTQTDWKTLFPKTIPAQAAEYKRVAEAFQYMNEHWLDQNLVLSEIDHQFGLAMNSLGYVDDHLKYLSGFKQLLGDTARLTQPFLPRLNAPLLESYLGMSMNSFYERHRINPLEIDNNDPKWAIASLEALNVLRTHPALQGKNDSLRVTVSELATVASTSEFLLRLLKEEPHSDALISNILKNMYCNETVTGEVLESKFYFDVNTLLLVAKKCTNHNLIDRFLLKENLKVSVLQALCDHPFLTEEHLLCLLKKVTIQDQNTLGRILKHPAATSAVKKAIFQHIAVCPGFISAFIRLKKFTSEDMPGIFENPYAIDQDVLINVLSSYDEPEIQIKVLSHLKCTAVVREIAIDLPSFSAQIAAEIIKTPPNRLEDYDVLTRLMNKVFDEYKDSKDKNWENILIQIINYYPSEGEKLEDLLTIIKQNAMYISPALGFTLFDKFEIKVFKCLSISEMINQASKEILLKFIDIKKTGRLSEPTLCNLGKQCFENGLMDQFLLRDDLTDHLICLLIKEFTFTETQLLLALEHVTDNLTVAAIYNYPKVTQKVRDAVLEHNTLTAELVEPLVLQKEINDNKLIKILSSKMVITSSLFQTIIKQTTNADVLLAVLKHPLGDSTVVQEIIKNPQFSPFMAQQFIASFNTVNLLFDLAKLAFSKIKTDKEWENCLIKVFEHSISNKRTIDLIRTMIQENKSIISTKLGFNILRLFGKSMAIYLSPENMLAQASESELAILLDPSCALSEAMHLGLVEKCNSIMLIDRIISKGSIPEAALLALLKKENLRDYQLLLILKNATLSTAAFKLIHNHIASTSLVKQFLYSHPQLKSTLLLELNIEDEAWLLMLKNDNAISKKVLAHIAKTTSNQKVLTAVAKHFKSDTDVICKIIDNASFSKELADWIIDTSDNLWSEYEILQKIIKKAFVLCRDEKNSQLDNWENCLIKCLKKYHQRFNDNDVLEIIMKEQIDLPKLGLEIFKLYGQQFIEQLPLKAMISLADNAELQLLVDPTQTHRLSEEILILLANKSSSNATIETFLERPELSPNVLHIVLAKPLDYKNLNKALRHRKFTEDDQQNWLEKMAQWRENRKVELLNSPANQRLKLSTALDALRLKACEHAMRALTDEAYIPVAATAVNLYQILHQEVDSYLDKKSNTFNFQTNCKHAINEASSILGSHRGYKQIFMDILNVILSAITFKFAWSDKWRFFEIKTATVEAVDEFEENVEGLFTIMAG
ncbi:MAG: hypothetical protein H0T84_10590 [Tatlockia sp.]|nr:hypothetical protein [Tatlockia sp.]